MEHLCSSSNYVTGKQETPAEQGLPQKCPDYIVTHAMLDTPRGLYIDWKHGRDCCSGACEVWNKSCLNFLP